MRIDDQNQAANNEQVNEDADFTQENSCPDCGGEQCANVSDEAEAPADSTSKMAEEIFLWKDKYTRLSAEFDNYRKRTLKEKIELMASAGEDVIKALLPVLDDLDRALLAMQTAQDVAAVREGVELISHKLRETLRAKGVAEIEALGQELDTDLHEAIARIPSEKCNSGKVVDVAQKGYKLNDKVIRHAKVAVGE